MAFSKIFLTYPLKLAEAEPSLRKVKLLPAKLSELLCRVQEEFFKITSGYIKARK